MTTLRAQRRAERFSSKGAQIRRLLRSVFLRGASSVGRGKLARFDLLGERFGLANGELILQDLFEDRVAHVGVARP